MSYEIFILFGTLHFKINRVINPRLVKVKMSHYCRWIISKIKKTRINTYHLLFLVLNQKWRIQNSGKWTYAKVASGKTELEWKKIYSSEKVQQSWIVSIFTWKARRYLQTIKIFESLKIHTLVAHLCGSFW